MKRMLFAAFAMLLCLGLAACGTDASPPSGESLVPPPSGPVEPLEIRQVSVEPPEMDSVWEIPGTARLSLLQECCPVGTERLTLVVENTGEVELGYGVAFDCEKYVDGWWQSVPGGDFPTVMMTAQPHSIETMDIHLNYLPEPLGEGVYRLTGTSLALGETGEETEPWQLDVRIAADATAEPDYCLYIPGQPVSGLAENLPVHFINTTGRDGYVVDIPHLERQNQDGAWTEVPYKEGIGFCGTPSTLPAGGRNWSENVLMLWGMLEEGRYRLHYQAGADFDTAGAAYGEFDVAPVEFIACG